MKYLMAVLIAGCAMWACSSGRSEDDHARYASVRKIKYEKIAYDTILLNHPNSSYVGRFGMSGDSIYFADGMYATLATFDKKGNLRNMFLGKGEGPREVRNIHNLSIEKDYNYIFENWNVHVFNKQWNKVKVFTMNWNYKRPLEEVKNNPKAHYNEIYEVKYFGNQYAQIGPGRFLFNIESTHPKFNGYMQKYAKQYYEEAKIFGVLNVHTNKVEMLAGNYPHYYTQHYPLPIFANWHYDFKNDSIYLNFESEEKIYVMDKNFRKVRSFGIPPQQPLNNAYTFTKSPEEYDKIVKDERKARGIYASVYFSKDRNTLFRTVYLGEGENAGAMNYVLQVYENNDLVGEHALPFDCKIIGEDDEYLYAEGLLDETASKMSVYRIKLS